MISYDISDHVMLLSVYTVAAKGMHLSYAGWRGHQHYMQSLLHPTSTHFPTCQQQAQSPRCERRQWLLVAWAHSYRPRDTEQYDIDNIKRHRAVDPRVLLSSEWQHTLSGKLGTTFKVRCSNVGVLKKKSPFPLQCQFLRVPDPHLLVICACTKQASTGTHFHTQHCL